ncbi:MAG: DnaA/Hda family protein [Alphaproteobacteria bacterium]
MTGVARGSQFALPFGHRPSLGGTDFLVSSCNSDAVAWIDRWPDWPGPVLALVGPPASGKTHLASVFAARTGAVWVDLGQLAASAPAELAASASPLIIDDAHSVAGNVGGERALFHLINYLAGQTGRLLLGGGLAPARWNVRLPDLASRLNTLPVAEIGPPDDELMAALVVKLFADRQLQVGMDVVLFMVARMERSFEAASALVAAIDARALESRREVTVPLVREVMEEFQD